MTSWRVRMKRKFCGKAQQEMRENVAYVRANSAEEALRAAERIPKYYAFKAVDARKL